MKEIIGCIIVAALVAAGASAARAGELDAMVGDAVKTTCEQFKSAKLNQDDVAVTVIDLRDAAAPRRGSFRGDQPIFPASVVKLFYLAAAHRWMEDGKLQDSPELRRAMKDMIVDSNNDATAMVLEALTDATNGAPLPPAQMEEWSAKRNAVNRYFESLGYAVGGEHGINACQKTYCEGPYGRERIFLGPKFENRNRLTTDATARLLSEIVSGKTVSTDRSQQMMTLLKRDPTSKTTDPDSQSTGFTAMALRKGARLWSKAGWTSTARHDAAYIETDDGVKVIIVTFTTGHARERKIIPAIAAEVLKTISSRVK
jgi:hypothetical protein